jgi:hypothetical protein
MRTKENIKKKASEVSEQDIKLLQALIEEIKMILQTKKINEETLTKLGNMITTLNSLRENYMWRLIRAAKQNHMLD